MTLRVGMLAHEGCAASGLSGFADVLAVANLRSGQDLFAVKAYSPDGRAVRSFSGAWVPVDGAIQDVPGLDLVYAPPAFGGPWLLTGAAQWVRRVHGDGAVACGACAGVFVLAQAGILQGRTATTHWGLAEAFRAAHPGVRLEPERMLVDGGDTVCAGGVTAFYDLALHLVARFVSSELAADCARTLLLDPGRVRQTPYMRLTGPVAHGDALVAEAQAWLEERHARPVSMGELAALVHVSERTLTRRFRRATGAGPLRYLQALRVEHAKRLLETGDWSVEEILAAVGYQDAPAFFRLFRTLTGLTPGEYRSRFSLFWDESRKKDRAAGLRAAGAAGPDQSRRPGGPGAGAGPRPKPG